MKIEVEDGGLVFSEVYSGIAIRADRGVFGIAERDGGIEVVLDGEMIFASEHDVTMPKEMTRELVFVVQGEDVPVLAFGDAPLACARNTALVQSGMTSQYPDEWEVRNIYGVRISDVDSSVLDHEMESGTRLFLIPKAGAGG